MGLFPKKMSRKEIDKKAKEEAYLLGDKSERALRALSNELKSEVKVVAPPKPIVVQPKPQSAISASRANSVHDGLDDYRKLLEQNRIKTSVSSANYLITTDKKRDDFVDVQEYKRKKVEPDTPSTAFATESAQDKEDNSFDAFLRRRREREAMIGAGASAATSSVAKTTVAPKPVAPQPVVEPKSVTKPTVTTPVKPIKKVAADKPKKNTKKRRVDADLAARKNNFDDFS